ncbi:hypothetical protein [Leyella stercorea]|uniref:hypothetical protein n=1 Tax=Leyella stercorea TaxID=363265 RepID=UPI0026765CB0|nr:hypothetical protein [Leyella stercorea]
MKHIFCISLLLLSVSCVFAQKIYVDRIETDGRRQVVATTKEYSVDDKDFNFCLKVFESSDRRDWLLLVSSYAPMSMESVLLLKLWNEAILRLNVNNIKVDTETKPAYAATIGSMTTTIGSMTATIGSITTIHPSKDVNYYYSVYELTPEEIEYMGKYGIKKIRIANGEKVWDKDFKFDSLGAYLSRGYKKILKQLETPIKKDKKKNIFDGF